METKGSYSVVPHPMHWCDNGGGTLESLKAFLTEHTGTPVTHVDVEFVDSVEEMRSFFLLES